MTAVASYHLLWFADLAEQRDDDGLGDGHSHNSSAYRPKRIIDAIGTSTVDFDRDDFEFELEVLPIAADADFLLFFRGILHVTSFPDKDVSPGSELRSACLKVNTVLRIKCAFKTYFGAILLAGH